MLRRYSYCKGLVKLKYNDAGYFTNIEGEIRDCNGNQLDSERDADGFQTLELKSWDGYRKYRIIDLLVIQFKNLKIPENKFNQVQGFPIDGNKDNLFAGNIGYRFKYGKIESLLYPHFYHIPGFTGYLINEEGIILNGTNGRQISTYFTKPDPKKNIKGGYCFARLYFDNRVSSIYGRHRALCLVFKNYQDNVDSLVVNHIDGIPGNDNLDNLEWITRGQNNQHAYEHDLKNQNKRVLVRNAITGKVQEFYSIAEANRKIFFTDSTVLNHRLYKSEFSKMFADGLQVKFKDDNRDWIIPDNPKELLKKLNRHKSIKVRNCKTLSVTEYKNVHEASKATGVKRGTILYNLNKNRINPCFGYQFMSSDYLDDFPDFTNEEYLNSLTEFSFKVSCRNLLTNETMEFDSVNECLSFMGNKNIPFLLRSGKQPYLANGWQIKFQNDKWEDIEDPEAAAYHAETKITALHLESDKIFFAESAREMGRLLGLDSKSIRKAALTRGNKIYHGYRFRLGNKNEPWPSSIEFLNIRNKF